MSAAPTSAGVAGPGAPEQAPATPAAAAPGPARLLVPALLFVLALAVRLVSWTSVFRPWGVLPYGNDAFYHLRRIRFALAHFPASLGFDPLLNHPHGGHAIWPPTLDWLVAAVLWPFLEPGSPHVETVVVLLPPLVGAATVVAVHHTARGLFGARVAGAAGAILAFLPAHFFYSQLGFFDHHVFVALLAWLLLAATLPLLGEAPAAHPLRRALGPGLAMAAALAVWPGTLLHVGLVQLAMVARLVGERTPSAAPARALAFALVHGVAALAIAPLALGHDWPLWGRFSAVVLSDFQLVYLGAAALCFGAAGGLWWRGLGVATAPRRALAMAAIGAAVLAAVAVATELPRAWLDAWSWLARDERFQSMVNESAPLLPNLGEAARGRAEGLLTPFVYVAPLALAGLVWRDRRRPGRLAVWAWSSGLLIATLAQWRFVNSYALGHSLALAASGVALFDRLAAAPPRRRRAGRAVLGLALAGYALVFLGHTYGTHARHLARALRGQPPGASFPARQKEALVEAARFLADYSASHSVNHAANDADDDAANPASNDAAPGAPASDRAPTGVLAPWGDGHLLKYVAGLPVVQDNFGDDVAPENFARAERYFAARDEDEALAAIAPLEVRYVLARSTGSGRHAAAYAPDSLRTRLWRFSGASARTGGGRGGGPAFAPALARHRLVYETARSQRQGQARVPYAALFEIVPGALIEGLADPGAPIDLELRLTTTPGRAFLYTARTRADARGRYRLRVPYPNEPFSPGVSTAARYRLRSPAATGTAVVPERAVTSGAVVAGPALGSAPEPPPAPGTPDTPDTDG